MGVAFPGESAEYRAARDRLLEQEIELRRADGGGGRRPARAAARVGRSRGLRLPGGGRGWRPRRREMSELFAPGKDSLVIYNFMFPRDLRRRSPGARSGQTARLPLEEGPCPSCVALLDQLTAPGARGRNGSTSRSSAKTPLPRLLTWPMSGAGGTCGSCPRPRNTYNRDYLGETADGSQVPMLNVFHRDGETIRHFWGAELTYAPIDPGQDHRSVGTLEPLWNLFDLTPEGRPDWDEQLDYQ